MTVVPPPSPADLTEASHRSAMQLYGIYEISKILSGVGSLTEIFATTVSVLQSFLDMNHAFIALLDHNGDPELLATNARDNAAARAYFDSLPEKVIGQIMVTEIPVVVENVAVDTTFVWNSDHWRRSDGNVFMMGVPIRDRDRPIGVLTFDRTWTEHPPRDNDEDLRFLKMVANLVGQTVRLHRLVARDREHLLEDQRRLAHQRALASPEQAASAAQSIIGDSPALREVLEKLRRVACSESPVLLRGESGTGKELFAQALHDLSRRRKKPIVKLNCAALPESVLESELFGHEKGAFTGALTQRKGRFEQADGGTLFLDEIGEISPTFQAKLLRVLQEGEFERVGGNRTLKVDVRLVTATNRNLEAAVAEGSFRADLYYRIAVVPLFLPPLRERREDIPVLAGHFLSRFNVENGVSLGLSSSGVDVLKGCPFPGNIRELESCVRRTAVMASGPLLEARDFACHDDGCLASMLWRGGAPGGRIVSPASPPSSAPASVPPPVVERGPEGGLPEGRLDRQGLVDVMERSGWVQAKAARMLGLTPRQIGYALRRWGIEIRKF